MGEEVHQRQGAVTSRRVDLRQLATSAAALFGALIVVDGDTVKMDGRSYRLLGYDTPGPTSPGASRSASAARRRPRA
jgi:endonuclease YncB( thermonuclease family)